MSYQDTEHTIGMKQFGLLALSLVILLASVGAYTYLMYEIDTAIEEIALAKGSVESVGKRSAAVQAAERFLFDTASEQKTLARYIVTDTDVVRPIEIIEAAARRERVEVEISSATTLEVPEWQHHEMIRVTFSGRGSYASLVYLASALETLPFAAQLERVALEAAADSWFGTYAVLIVKEKAP